MSVASRLLKSEYASALAGVLVGLLVTVGLAIVAVSQYNRHFGEVSAAEVIELQSRNHKLLYLSGIDQDVAEYKLLLTKKIKPEVIVIGSSRAMQVRAEFFSVPMVSWAGVGNSVAHIEWAANQIAALEKKPKIVLLFTDVWWFNANYENPKRVYRPPSRQWLRAFVREIRISFRLVLTGKGVKKQDNRLGIAANRSDHGYDRAGSFHNVRLITQSLPDADVRFEGTLSRIRSGSGRFKWAATASEEAIDRLKRSVRKLRQSGIEVVVILPPFAKPVIDEMESSGNFKYLSQVKSLGLDYSRFGERCEFLDGFHAGEVSYARLLLETPAKQYLRSDLSSWVQRHRGMTSPLSLQYTDRKPIDFLGLGC